MEGQESYQMTTILGPHCDCCASACRVCGNWLIFKASFANMDGFDLSSSTSAFTLFLSRTKLSLSSRRQQLGGSGSSLAAYRVHKRPHVIASAARQVQTLNARRASSLQSPWIHGDVESFFSSVSLGFWVVCWVRRCIYPASSHASCVTQRSRGPARKPPSKHATVN